MTHLLAWISQADAKALVIGAGVIAAAITAVIVLARTVLGSRPMRYVGRALIVAPLLHALNEWAASPGGIYDRLGALEAQHHRNGGSTTRDRVEAIADAVGAAKPPPPMPHDPSD